MTEAEWLGCTEPAPLLGHVCEVQRTSRTRVGRRRLTLFGCACLRRLLELASVSTVRAAIEVAENHAEVPRLAVVLAQEQETYLERLHRPATHRTVPPGLFISLETAGWFLLRGDHLRENAYIVARITFHGL